MSKRSQSEVASLLGEYRGEWAEFGSQIAPGCIWPRDVRCSQVSQASSRVGSQLRGGAVRTTVTR